MVKKLNLAFAKHVKLKSKVRVIEIKNIHTTLLPQGIRVYEKHENQTTL